MIPKTLAVALAVAVSAEGATAFRVNNETRVTVSGENVCIEVTPVPGQPVTEHAYVSKDGGETFIAINHDNQTWFPIDDPALTPATRFCDLYPNPTVRRVKWSLVQQGANHHVGTLSYVLTHRIADTSVDVRCSVALDIVTTNEHPRRLWPAKTFLFAGYPAVDERIGPDLARIDGFPLRIAVKVTKQFTGGKPFSEEHTRTVTDVQTVPDRRIPACERPAGYREQRPVIAAPGGAL